MTKFYDAAYSFERVGGYQFVKLYISMFEKWLESPQWLLAVSKPEVRMRVTSAWGQEYDFNRTMLFFSRYPEYGIRALPVPEIEALSLTKLHTSGGRRNM